MSFHRFVACIVGICLTAPRVSAQTLLTSAFVGTQATDFDAACVAPGDNEICFGAGPLAVGANGFNATLSANFAFAAYGRLNTGFGSNGNWYTRNGVSASAVNVNYVSLAFTTSLTHIGAFMNYEPDVAAIPTLRAYNAANQLIADFSLSTLAPISTPGVNDAALFRGIEYAGGIHRIELRGSNLSATDFLVIPAGTQSVVPEPSTYALMASGLAGLFAVARRRRPVR